MLPSRQTRAGVAGLVGAANETAFHPNLLPAFEFNRVAVGRHAQARRFEGLAKWHRLCFRARMLFIRGRQRSAVEGGARRAFDTQFLRVLLKLSTSFFRWPFWSCIEVVIDAVLRCYVAAR